MILAFSFILKNKSGEIYPALHPLDPRVENVKLKKLRPRHLFKQNFHKVILSQFSTKSTKK